MPASIFPTLRLLALAATNSASLNCTASLTNDDFMKGLAHITLQDLPETVETLYTLAESAGFAQGNRLYQKPWRQAH